MSKFNHQNKRKFSPCFHFPGVHFGVTLFLTTARSASSALLPFLGEGSPTKIDYRKKGTLILTTLLEDLDSHMAT